MPHKKNIYIVDDIQENLQVLANVLTENNFNISIARNGEQALVGILKKKPDLILLDISMPGMDGYEVCHKLKEEKATTDIPIIFITAHTQTEDIVKGFKVGGVDYITKPFKSEELLSRVNTHIELKEAKEKLLELNAAKDKFFRIIAHDLKSPFNSFLGLTDIILKNKELSLDEVREMVEHLNNSAKSTFKLLENLLEWARNQSGKLEFNPVKIDLNELILENVALVKECVNNKSINLETDLSAEKFVVADKNMLSTVLRNLVSNAIKFTREKGKIKITKQSRDHEIEVNVIDNGVGIDSEDLKKLFKIDMHHTTSGTNHEKGTGLGLILCKEFIEKHNGKLSVKSELNKGSEFTFTLPL